MLNINWNNYKFEDKEKYLIYYTGNFSPPHKGHMHLIEPFFNKKNIQILINLWGNEKKHDFSIEKTMQILSVYLKDVKNIVFEKNNPENIYNYKKIDKLIFIRGNENFNATIKNEYLEIYGKYIKKLRKKGILTEVLFINRIPKISSTEMCNDENKINYLPNYLSQENKEKVLEILKT